MDTRTLEYFIAVAEELNFTRAAARSFVVQSTISAGIRSLEAELGTTLFDRSARQVALTPTGEALLSPARDVIDAADKLTSVALGGVRGRLRVGIFANLDVLDLAGVLAEFRTRYPLVELQLVASPTGSTGLADDVRRGRVDLAFMGLPADELTGVDAVELFSSPVVAVLPRAHPLARRRSIRVEDIADEPFVDTPVGFGNRVMAERALAVAGVHRRVPTEVASLADIGSFVAAGFGVALAPEVLVASAHGTVLVALANSVLWTMSVVTRPHPSAASIALRDLIVDRYAASGATERPTRRSE